jgi:hypothetical protein
MGVVIGFVAARTMWGIVAIFRFLLLGWKKVVDLLEYEFMSMDGFACGGAKSA